MLNALLVAAALVSQTPPAAEPEAPPEPNKWELFVGLTGGLRTESTGFGGVGVIGINRRLFSWLRPELSVGLGGYDAPIDAVIPIRIGTRIEWPGDGRLKPYVFVAFAHQHEMAWEHAKMDPVLGVLGLSSHGEHGVNHRSGLDTGLGLSFEFLRLGGWGFKANLRASLVQLLGDGPPRYIDVTGTIGLTF